MWYFKYAITVKNNSILNEIQVVHIQVFRNYFFTIKNIVVKISIVRIFTLK